VLHIRHVLIFSLFLAVAWALSGPQVLAAEAPADFSITLASGPIHSKNPLETESITIKADGTATIAAHLDGAAEVAAKTVHLAKAKVDGIYAQVVQENFFGLKPVYANPNVMDGDYATLNVTANGQTHQVKTVNIRVDAFDRIALWINGNFEPDDMVIYNAFIDRGMDGVER
jgi:hypothetical protein